MAHTQLANDQILRTLEGRQCEYCEEGKLERDTYKGNDAIVCESCGIPTARIW